MKVSPSRFAWVVVLPLVGSLAGCVFESYSDPIPVPASYSHRAIAEVTPATQRADFASVTTVPTTAPTPAAPVVIDDRLRDAILQGVHARVAQRYTISTNPQLNEYLILVGSLVTIKTPKPDVEYAYQLLDTADPVSFAVWPKTICISTGLIQQMEDESELAGVLAREISNLLTARPLTAAGIPAPAEPATRPASQPATQPLNTPEQRAVREHVTKLTKVLLEDDLPPEAQQAADREAAQYAAAALYAPDGLLRLLTRQKNATANWPRIQALDTTTSLIAKANPAATNKLPVRFEGYVRGK